MSQVEVILFEVVPAFIIGGVSVMVFGLLPLYRRMSNIDSSISHLEAQIAKIDAQIDLLLGHENYLRERRGRKR